MPYITDAAREYAKMKAKGAKYTKDNIDKSILEYVNNFFDRVKKYEDEFCATVKIVNQQRSKYKSLYKIAEKYGFTSDIDEINNALNTYRSIMYMCHNEDGDSPIINYTLEGRNDAIADKLVEELKQKFNIDETNPNISQLLDNIYDNAHIRV